MTALRVVDDHLELANIGSNTHAQIDIELSSLRGVSSAADSPMVITGGEISEGTGAGTFKVAALTAMLRSTNSSIGDLVAVSLAEQDDQAITLVDTIYRVILSYNGGAPTISVGVDNPYGSDKRNIPIGRVMRDAGGTVHYLSSGYRLQDGVEKLHERARAVRDVELESGSTIAYSGVDNFTMTEGLAYAGINSFEIASYDSAAVTFVPVYQDGGGGWAEGVPSNTIDHLHYDDGSGALDTVGNNKYGCFWPYKHIEDDHVYVLYGRDSYTLAEAEAAGEPTRPDHLAYFGLLLGKIVAPQAGGSFTTVQMVTDVFFSGVAASDHNNLGGLQGGTLGEYYHLTSVELTKLTGIEDGATTDQTKADIDGLGLSHDSLADVSANDHHNELHSIVSHNDTTATGAQLDTLTDNSIVDALHRHSELVASDGSPDPALKVRSDGNVGIGISNPVATLHVYKGETGTVGRYEGAGNEFVGMRQDSEGDWRIYAYDTGTSLFVPISFGDDTLRIDAPNQRVGIGTLTPVTSAKLELSSKTGALLLTRMSTAQKNALTAVNGMVLYDSTLNKFQGYENGSWTSLI